MEQRSTNDEFSGQTPNQLAAELDARADELTLLTRAIAGAALRHTTQQELLRAAADRVLDSATHARSTIEGLIIEDQFGDEASYWTVFRLFADKLNVGTVWSLEEIWNHLTKNYDMSGENIASVEATLLEWGADIEEDAAVRGIHGHFTQLEGGYLFAETASSAAARRLRTNVFHGEPTVINTKPAAPKRRAPEEAPPYQDLKDAIARRLEQLSGRTAKQADIKKTLVRDDDFEPTEQLQQKIDALVHRGDIYKYRRNKVAYLALDPQPDEIYAEGSEQTESESESLESIDIQSSLAVLRTLTAPGTHYNQKLTMSDLWRRINDADSKSKSIPASELDTLKRVCRQLQRINLVTAGGEKMGTGGVRTNSATSSKRRRSATRQVFKVGIESQDRKKEIQELLEDAQSDQTLLRRFVDAL